MLYTYKQLKDGVAARSGPDYVVTFRNIRLITTLHFISKVIPILFIPTNLLKSCKSEIRYKNPHRE